MKPPHSASRFLIVSGTYVFLILLAASLCTVHDHAWGIGLPGLRDLFFIPVWICIPFFVAIAKKLAEKQEGKEFIGKGKLVLVLILSVAGWFLLNMEEKPMADMKEAELVVLIFKIAGLCISVVLLSLAYVFLNRKAGPVLLILELIFWTLKTLITYPASADLIFSGYFTVICCMLRLLLITKLIMRSKAPVDASV